MNSRNSAWTHCHPAGIGLRNGPFPTIVVWDSGGCPQWPLIWNHAPWWLGSCLSGLAYVVRCTYEWCNLKGEQGVNLVIQTGCNCSWVDGNNRPLLPHLGLYHSRRISGLEEGQIEIANSQPLAGKGQATPFRLEKVTKRILQAGYTGHLKVKKKFLSFHLLFLTFSFIEVKFT